MRSRQVLPALLLLAACASPARRDWQRVDIDEHLHQPPELGFAIDCTALPYAKGEEAQFCRETGCWAVLRQGDGLVVACSCGEFGGFATGGNMVPVAGSGEASGVSWRPSGTARSCVPLRL